MIVIRTLAAWAFTAVFWPVVVIIDLASFKGLRKHDRLVRLIRWWGRTTLAIVGIRVERLNASTLETRAPRVVVCNHQSALDIVWGATICPPAPLAIGKKEVAYIPILNLIWWALDFIRIDRKDPRRAIAAISSVPEKVVRQTRSLFIAPEGTRSPTGQVLPFKKGAFHLAIQGGIPIYPVVVQGAFELMPKTRVIARPGVIRLKFLDPVPTAGLGPDDVDSLLTRVRQQIVDEFEKLQRG